MRKAWKYQGHKQECRGKGDFREGDMVALKRAVGAFAEHETVILLTSHFENDSTKCAINAEDAATNSGQWLVQNEKGTTSELVSEKDIRRIRSTMWHAWGTEDIRNVAKQVIEAKKTNLAWSFGNTNVLPELGSINNMGHEENFDSDGDDDYSIGDDETAE